MRTRARLAVIAAGGIALATSLAGTGMVTANAATGPAIPQYTLTLGLPNVSYLAINSHGDILGQGFRSNGALTTFILPAGSNTPEWLPVVVPSGSNDQRGAAAINDLDQAVGASVEEVDRPLFWPAGNTTATDLGVNPGGIAVANGINDNGQIVGENSTGAPNYTQSPWLDHNGQVTNLPTLTGSAMANAVNNAGFIVGSAATTGGNKVAVAWQNGTITSLGQRPGGSSSEALAVNQDGVAVGDATANSCTDSAIFDHGTVTVLPQDPDGVCAYPASADAINDSGTVVGVDGVLNPYVYQNGVATQIKDLIPAATAAVFYPDTATGINDAGVIVGKGLFYGDGPNHGIEFGYTLTPVHTGS